MLIVILLSVHALFCSGAPSNDQSLGLRRSNNGLATTDGFYSLALCILYRLDVVNCNKEAPIPPVHQTITYAANPYPNCFTRRFACDAKKDHVSSTNGLTSIPIRPHKEVGSTEYPARILQYFHIQCPTGRFARFVTGSSSIELEGRHSIGDQNICLDYVQIKLLATGEECEICGNEALTDKCGSIVNRTYSYSTSNMLITFRSDPIKQESGFKINIACNANEMEEEGIGECLKTSSSLSWNEYKRMIQSPNYIEYTEAISHVPYDATGILFDFYGDYHYKSLKAPVKSYKGMLSLARIAQKSCDASTRTVARDVQDLFPYSMREEVPYFEEQPTGDEEPMGEDTYAY